MDASLAVIWHQANHEGIGILKNHPALSKSIQIVDVTAAAGKALPYATITLEEIAEQKSDILYFFKFPDLAHLIELEVLGSSHGNSHFIQADYSVDIDHPEVVKYCKAFSITRHSISNRGHANPEEISDLIERIAPKAVIPVHGFHTKLLDTKGIGAYYPQKGRLCPFLLLLRPLNQALP